MASDLLKGDYAIPGSFKAYTKDNMLIYGSAMKDKIKINGKSGDTVYAGAGDDIITLSSGSNENVVYGEKGNDFIGVTSSNRMPSGKLSLYGGDGNDTIRVDKGNRIFMDGGAGNDLFIPLGDTSPCTIVGGAGNDTIRFIESSTVTASGGAGNNVYYFDPYGSNLRKYSHVYHNSVLITDISGNDVIRFSHFSSDGSELSIREENGNIILNDDDYGVFTITLKGGSGKKSEIGKIVYETAKDETTLAELFPSIFSGGGNAVSVNAAGTAVEIFEGYDAEEFDVGDYGSKIKTIKASATSDGLSIIGNNLANRIIGGDGDDTLFGGKGTDTLTGGNGADVFVYENGNGNKVITDYDEEDRIEIRKGSLKSASVKGSNVILTIGSGKITVKGGKNKDITVIDSHGEETVYYNGMASSADLFEDDNFLTADSRIADVSEVAAANYPATNIRQQNFSSCFEQNGKTFVAFNTDE